MLGAEVYAGSGNFCQLEVAVRRCSLRTAYEHRYMRFCQPSLERL